MKIFRCQSVLLPSRYLVPLLDLFLPEKLPTSITEEFHFAFQPFIKKISVDNCLLLIVSLVITDDNGHAYQNSIVNRYFCRKYINW